MTMKTEPELIPEGPSWLVRKSVKPGKLVGHTIQDHRFKYELVYGTWETKHDKDGLVVGREVVGTVYHTLTGDNGRKAIEEQADRYNLEGKIPAKASPKTVSDGYKPTLKDDSTASLFDAVVLQQCISYEPERKP